MQFYKDSVRIHTVDIVLFSYGTYYSMPGFNHQINEKPSCMYCVRLCNVLISNHNFCKLGLASYIAVS